MDIVLRLLRNDSGATAIEYAIILAAVAIAGFVSYNGLSSMTLELFERTIDAFPSF